MQVGDLQTVFILFYKYTYEVCGLNSFFRNSICCTNCLIALSIDTRN